MPHSAAKLSPPHRDLGATRQPGGLLPSQLRLTNHQLYTPEMRLAAAVLEDAVHCIVQNADARGGSRFREFLEARNWFWEERPSWPFAFVNVCDLLGLDAGAVRARLQRLLAASPPSTQPGHPAAHWWSASPPELRRASSR